MEIIDFEEKYRDQVINLWINICIDEYGFEKWRDSIEHAHNSLFKNNNGEFLIAIIEYKVIGTISLKNLGDNVGEIKGFYVDKNYRRHKIGLNLMNHLVEFAKKAGYTHLTLDTYDVFEDAKRFYLKYGFECIGRRGDMILLQKTIWDFKWLK